jgi:adenosylcobinamide kinase/adenosylcobinamide-phosphate guanylyltransferase
LITLLTGGVKSGKSSRALEIAQSWPTPVIFIATAAVLDGEICERVRRHQAERAALGWATIEEQVELGGAIARASGDIVLDCLTMWVNNLFMADSGGDSASAGAHESNNLSKRFDTLLSNVVKQLRAKKDAGRSAVIVTNETGLGNIPFDPLTRQYNLLLAQANREIAAVADRVELLVCGIPLKVK